MRPEGLRFRPRGRGWLPQRQRGAEHERGAGSATRGLGMCTPIVSTVSTMLNETELLGRFAQTDSLM